MSRGIYREEMTMASNNVVRGDPENWPRTCARSHADLDEAIADLYANLDQSNAKFAIREFIRERLTMVLSTLRD